MALAAQHFPQPLERQHEITRIIRILMAKHGVRHQSELAPVLGLKDGSAVTKRMRGSKPWTIADLDALASSFGEPIEVFFRSAADVLRIIWGTEAAGHSPALSVVETTLGANAQMSLLEEAEAQERRLELAPI